MSASPIPPISLDVTAKLPTVALDPNLLSDLEIHQMAGFFAGFLLYDIEAAAQHSASWYRRQVGEDVCSISRAIRLRQLTIEACCSSSDEVLEAGSGDSGSLELWIAAQIGLKFLLAFVVLAGVWLAVCVAWVEGGLR